MNWISELFGIDTKKSSNSLKSSITLKAHKACQSLIDRDSVLSACDTMRRSKSNTYIL